ncbi:MAG TPA: twin-arginine translocase TatA/TatE family subunit [Deltaproteobacteria bacterium]|nr:twin-arginine translocase TatA/TatE family subunit [Deltaproteobacteria bacterium]
MLPSWQELIPILLLAVVIFGAKKLPEIGSGLGKGLKNFKKSLKDTENEIAIEERGTEEKNMKNDKKKEEA